MSKETSKDQNPPPRGIKPQFLWRETRIADLREALQRYRDHNHGSRQKAAASLMRDWEEEIAEHQAWLHARSAARKPSDLSDASEPSEPAPRRSKA